MCQFSHDWATENVDWMVVHHDRVQMKIEVFCNEIGSSRALEGL